MLALPAPTAVTTPAALTDATAEFVLDQTMALPVSTLLPASRSVADACVVCPTVREEFASDTDTEVTGAAGEPVTVTMAESTLQATIVLLARTTKVPWTGPAT
jgi:hypothetical protein